MPRLKVNEDTCVGCLACELACSFRQTGEFNLKRSGIQIQAAGMFPGRARVCRQCFPAPCLQACPEEAIQRENSIINLEREKCSGCGLCVEACPYAGIKLDPQDGLARKCDLCGGDPECVALCPKGAISIEENSAETNSKP